jgi:hypothetical protein
MELNIGGYGKINLNIKIVYNIKMVEEWKEYDNYEFSNLGNVRRTDNKNVVNGSIQNKGYKYIQIKRNKKRKNLLIHQIVMKLFIGNRPIDKVVDHIDRNKLNNTINNLRYITQKENMFNCDRVYTHIPQDTPNRKKIVRTIYADNNKDAISRKRNIYKQKNKEIIQQKYKTLRFEVKCKLCNIKKNILEAQRNKLRRTKGINEYICGSCSNKINLRKANCSIIALHL